MKKFLSIILLVFTTLYWFSCNDNPEITPDNPDNETDTIPSDDTTETATMTEKDFLKTSGIYIKNNSGKGDIMLLRGTNLGGWLLREGWMDPVGYYSEDANAISDDYTSRMLMIERFGEGATDKLLDEYQEIYIQESDLDIIEGLGLNFVRVPFYWMEILDLDGNVKSSAFDQIDWVIEECDERNMYVILDLHGAPGGHSDGYLTGGQYGSNQLWTNTTYQSWTVKIWEAIAERYVGNPTVLAYDLLNEPVSSTSDFTIVDMYDILYDSVRAIDPDHIIMMGAFYNYDYLCDPDDMNWENVVYQTHHYDESNKNNEAGLQAYLQGQVSYMKTYRNRWGIPVYAGEYNFWDFSDLWEEWMTDLNEEYIMWSNWTYKNTDDDDINNWGFYTTNNNEQPDLSTDTKDEIMEKWKMFSTDNYIKNLMLTRAVKACTE